MTVTRTIPFIALLALAGCAAPIKTVDEARDTITSVHVLSTRHVELDHNIFNNPVRYLGLTGAIVAGTADRSRTRALQAHMGEFDVPGTFHAHLEQALMERGLEVSWATPRVDRPPQSGEAPPREYQRDGFALRRYYSATAGGDIQLDLAIAFAGYAAGGVGNENPYRPTVMVNLRLLSADGRRVLYQNAVHYNPINAGEDAVTMAPDPERVYPSFDDLRSAEPDVLRTALDRALKEAASSVANIVFGG